MAHGDHLKYQAKPKAGRQTLFRLTSYLVCDRLLLSVIGVLIVLSIAANLGGSYLLRPIINRYIIPGDFLGLGKMLGILIGVYLTGVFAVYVEYRLLNKIGQRTVALRIRNNLNCLLKDTTVLIITQRINTMQSADRVIVLEDGEVEAIGTPDELMATSRIYQEIYNSQQILN